MLKFLNKYKKAFIFFISFICIIMIFLTATYKYKPEIIQNSLGFVVIPVQKVANNTTQWINQKIQFFVHMKDLEAENEALKNENADLKFELDRLKLVEKDNEELTALLEMKQKYPDYDMVGARVIAKDMSNWSNNFVIDKGSDDGIEKNMIVLSEGGLVGRVIETGDNYSKVMPIIDESSSVSAENVRTGDVGIVQGNPDFSSTGYLTMNYIDANADITVGDQIVTSNLGDIYPAGLTIGYVKEVHSDDNGLTKYVVIEPVVDFSNIDNVLIIKDTFDKSYIN